MSQEGHEHERERRELMKDEEEIGENIPEAFHGVEGADVRAVERHGHVREDDEIVLEEAEEPSGEEDVDLADDT